MYRRAKGLMIDLSGTMHIEDKAVEGAHRALQRLRASRIPYLFVTNTTKETRAGIAQTLARCGLDIPENEIYTALLATACLCRRRSLRPFLIVNDEAIPDVVGVHTYNPNSVVVALAPDKFTYRNMSKAFRVLKDGGLLVATHKARYLQSGDGKLHLGPGPFVAALEYAADTSAVVVGKPTKSFFEGAADCLKLPLSETIMIGDDAENDVVGALNAGMEAVLVRTGKYRPGDELKGGFNRLVSCANVLEAVEMVLGDRK